MIIVVIIVYYNISTVYTYGSSCTFLTEVGLGYDDERGWFVSSQTVAMDPKGIHTIYHV